MIISLTEQEILAIIKEKIKKDYVIPDSKIRRIEIEKTESYIPIACEISIDREKEE